MKKDLAKEIYDAGYVTGYKDAISEFLEDWNYIQNKAEIYTTEFDVIRKKWEVKLKE